MRVTSHFMERFRERVDPNASARDIRAAAIESWERGKKPDPTLYKRKRKHPNSKIYEWSGPYIFVFTKHERNGKLEPVAVTVFDRNQSLLDAHRLRRRLRAQSLETEDEAGDHVEPVCHHN